MKKQRNKGFSMVELIVVIAIMVVLLAVLAPSLLKYVENSRMQKDESAMAEVCNAAQLALADSNTFDEVFSYAVPKNYTTYSDSSGVYGAKYTDEEFWAPDGSGMGVTITFNPDEDGNYYLADGQVNNMTFSNGSVGNLDIDSTKQTRLEDMGDGKLYAALKKSIGTTVAEKSATYKNSSYTMFIEYELTNGIYRPTITGAFNGTNLTDDSPAAIGGNTTPPADDNNDDTTPPVNNGNNSTPDISDSDLQGGGSVSNPENAPSTEPTEPEVPEEAEITYVDFIITQDNRSKIGYTDTTTDLVIPETFQDEDGTWYKVVGIEDAPSGFKSGVFSNCVNLISVTIPDSITSIGLYAFYGCSGMNSIIIGNSVSSIGTQAFRDCTSLAYVTMGSAVTSIGHGAFYDCNSLISIDIPNGVTSVEQNTFTGCTNLTSISIPDSVISIGVNAFTDCANITSINIPNSVESIGGYAFYGWSSLTSITYEGTINDWSAITKGLNWNQNAGNYTIHCTDGHIAKDGTVINNTACPDCDANVSNDSVISFSVKWITASGEVSGTYTAVSGMTWGEWVASEYNTDGFTDDGPGGKIMTPNANVVVDDTGSQRIGNVIVANYQYYV